MESSGKVIRWLLGIALLASALYVASGVLLVRFAIGSALLPSTPSFIGPQPDSVDRVTTGDGNELLIRRYGKPLLGCVVFFPGQHGYAGKYDLSAYMEAGIEVLLLGYPGQDGALGSASLDELGQLASRAMKSAEASCPEGRVVLLGVSLGSMLASYAARDSRIAGLILVSTAPSLSAAIRTRLRSKWYSAPLAALPLSRLLPRDYSLAEALEAIPEVGVEIFQGTEDAQTPLSDLEGLLPPPPRVRLTKVSGGTHSTTFSRALEAQLASIRRILLARGTLGRSNERDSVHDQPHPSAA